MADGEHDRGGTLGDVLFEDWYSAEFGKAVTTLRLVLGDARLAEEAVSEAFARALAAWPQVRTMDSPGGWLYRVALNQARSWLRRRGLERRYLDMHEPGDVAVAAADLDDDLWEAVRALPPRTRTALALRYVADLPEKEVAAIMRITRGAVAATLHRARTRLAEQLTVKLEEERR